MSAVTEAIASSPLSLTEPLQDSLLVLSQIKHCYNEDSGSVRLVENPKREALHNLPTDILKVDRCDLWECSNASEVSVDRNHELGAEAFPIVFESVEDFLQVGVCSREEFYTQTHRDVRMRAFTSSQAIALSGCRR